MEKEGRFLPRSKRETAFRRFKHTDPCCTAEVHPVQMRGKLNIYAMRTNPDTREKICEQYLAAYAWRGEAERISWELNFRKGKMLAAAYP